MDILSVLKENIAEVLDSLYGLSAARIDLQATREEFAGDVTLLVFPYAKASHKAPEETAREIGEALMQRCREQNVGFICMKPMAGGALEDARLALRFIRQNENVSVVIPGMYDVREIDQNLEAMEDVSPLTEAEKAKLDAIRKELGTQFCRRCNYCAPCTVGISIPNVFLFAGYLERYGLADWAKGRYKTLPVKASACIGCGKCEPRCPYGLPIRSMLKKCAEEFGE